MASSGSSTPPKAPDLGSDGAESARRSRAGGRSRPWRSGPAVSVVVAIRRCGELLAMIAPAKNQHDTARVGAGPSSRAAAARDAGLSPRQKREALRVARMSPDDFETALLGTALHRTIRARAHAPT